MVDAKPGVGNATGSNVPPKHGNSNNTFAGERSKIKLFMGRTPSIGVLKSKFLTVLGNSNELLNGISNKLTLSTSSSDSEYCDDDEEDLPKFDETIDYTKIDFEARRVKARRAHEEIISGRFRHPNLAARPRLENLRSKVNSNKALRSSSSSSSSSSSDSSSSISLPDQNAAGAERSHVSSTTRSNSIESRHSGGYERHRAIAGARRSELDIQKDVLTRTGELLSPCVETPHIDVQPPSDREYARQIWGAPPAAAAGVIQGAAGLNTSANSMRVPTRSRNSNSSTLTSLRDDPDVQISPSVESTDWRNFIRSESQNSVPSWASSISLDCRAGEEPVKEFMKHFTDMLFNNSSAIDLELKSEFGIMVRLEIGRQWFTRFLIEQKIKTKRVTELTFHSLVQFFSLVLFECSESEDYAPAAIIMNLCFLLYREIEVPGCDPYREYLFIFMRQQPFWHVMRFWNAACFDAMQMEREHRLSARLKRAEKRQQRKKAKEAAFGGDDVLPKRRPSVDAEKQLRKPADSSSSSSQRSNALAMRSNAVAKSRSANAAGAGAGSAQAQTQAQAPSQTQPMELTKEQEDIAFRQLGAFTCNMHSLGLPQSLCLDFLKKQVVSLNLPKDKSKLIRDNVHRMYHETELWGAKDT